MQKLSVFIVTKNEEVDIKQCLESVKWAHEIVVVDSNSTDKTVEIAKEYTDKVFLREWEGYSKQKNFALEKCTGDWVLNIDADERVTERLKIGIESLLKDEKPSQYVGYLVPFKFYFLGHHLRFGGCAGEYHLRLFKNGKGYYDDRKVHEGIKIEGKIGKMKGYIIHYSYSSLKEYLDKLNLYTDIIARTKYQKGERFHPWHLFRFAFEFCLRYIVKLGIFDGVPGFVYAFLSSFYGITKHIKVWELEKNIRS